MSKARRWQALSYLNASMSSMSFLSNSLTSAAMSMPRAWARRLR